MTASDRARLLSLRDTLRTFLIGQEAFVDRLLAGLLSGGHLLIEGVPGLAKTYGARCLAAACDARFARIQFTPDLLPADLVGGEALVPSTGAFEIRRGPIFANLLLADEINRAPAKVQSALLEAMQERQATIAGEACPLPRPFMVLATQNPIEHEGTYPLPEAQLDRFLMKLRIEYPSFAGERAILDARGGDDATVLPAPVASVDDILAWQAATRAVHLDAKIADYIVTLVRTTRSPGDVTKEFASAVEWGASPRASLALGRASRAVALLAGRDYVVPDDVKDVAKDVLRHRVLLSLEAEADGLLVDDLLDHLLENVAVP